MEAQAQHFAEVIRDAAARKSPLRIRGGASKDFYGGPLTGDLLDTRGYRGIVAYEPSELVITARAGTPLAEIEEVLDAAGQMLAFEPPHYGPATVGGCVAAGLSGPRRAAAGALRDFVLGVRLLDGRGDDLRFGGRVMKNVAGYDVSRVMAGAMGTLGVLLDISLKVLPRPAAEMTLHFESSAAQAITRTNAWIAHGLPLSATCHQAGRLSVRLSGAEAAVRTAHARIGGDSADAEGISFWHALREQTAPFFHAGALWRISLAPTAPPLDLPGDQFIEWNGALRWLAAKGNLAPTAVYAAAAAHGGHATLFRNDAGRGQFQPLQPALLALHRNLKQAFDPAGIFNPGRLYPEL